MQILSTLFVGVQLFSGRLWELFKTLKGSARSIIPLKSTEDISSKNLKQRADFVDSFFFRFGFVAMLLVSEKVKVTFPKWFCPQ